MKDKHCKASDKVNKSLSYSGELSQCWIRTASVASPLKLLTNDLHCQHLVQSSRHFRSSAILLEDRIVTVPPFAESVSEGDVRWNKAVGDSVGVDEVVCEIETDKTSVPVPSPGAGVIEELYVEDGTSVKAGQKLFKLKLGKYYI
ncbi:hypothetical protein J6590_046263 [Homalodisca vitripennis]|nr:hypothetical protein J6590_046263 [Homalodisca vitripennis]